VPFFLSAPPTAIAQNAKLMQNESGVKPPHSKTTPAPVAVAYQQTKSDRFCFAGPKPLGIDHARPLVA
jgi:hypothetical protein